MDSGSSDLDLKKTFSAISHVYDPLNQILSLGLHSGWRRKAAQQVNVMPGQRVLDLCAGTGDMACRVLEEGRGAFDVIAMDFCESMVRKARSKYTPAQYPRLFLILGDCMHLPFPGDAFHGITIAFGLRNLPDKPTALREMARVLAPGGRLVILEFTRPRRSVFSCVYHLYLHCLLPLAGGLLSKKPQAYRYLADSIAAFPSVGEIFEMLGHEGLKPLESIPLCGGIVTILCAEKHPED